LVAPIKSKCCLVDHISIIVALFSKTNPVLNVFKMKFLLFLAAFVAMVASAPVQEGESRVVRQVSGSAANAGAQSFNQGFGGFPGHGGPAGHGGFGGFTGSAASAGSQSFTQGGHGGHGGFTGSASSAGAQSYSQGAGGFPGFGGASGSTAGAGSQSFGG
uniref:Uncharacterized protein n=1 Tax=Anopheles atroparvus TaxID=41427 RepID=A0A182JFY3_ANOAO